jgi:hypothetical protein
VKDVIGLRRAIDSGFDRMREAQKP